MQCVALAPAECAAFPWRIHGNLYVTVVVKACLTFDEHGRLQRTDPEPFLLRDQLDDDGVLTRVVRSSDRVPRRNVADVTLNGHVAGREDVTDLWVRVRVVQGTTAVIDKRMLVRGDLVNGVRQPIDMVPLSYEHAFGGVGVLDNPVGCGAGDGREPNLVDPDAPERPIGFAPLSMVFPARRALFGKGNRRTGEHAIMELPDDLDWAYFNAAPVDQRPLQIHGNERIFIEGLAEWGTIDLQLPRVQAAFVAFGLAEGSDRARRFKLKLDTLHIDCDRRRLILAGRRELLVDRDRAADLIFVGGYELGGEEVLLPKQRPELPGDTQKLRPPTDDTMRTQEIDARVLDEPAGVPVKTIEIDASVLDDVRPPGVPRHTVAISAQPLENAPFALASAGLVPTSATRRLPWADDGSPAPLPPMPGADHTLSPGLPRVDPAPADRARTVVKSPAHRSRRRAHSLELRDQMLDSRPPPKQRPGQVKPVVGAPWSTAAKPLAPPSAQQTQTLTMDEELLDEMQRHREASVPVVAPKQPVVERPTTAWSSGPATEDTTEPRTPARVPRPRVNVRDLLYRPMVPKIKS